MKNVGKYMHLILWGDSEWKTSNYDFERVLIMEPYKQ